MRTLLFIICIISIISLAIFLSHKFGFFETKRTADNHELAEVNFNDDAVPSRWDSVFVGKWHLFERDDNVTSRSVIDMDIEFFGNHQFKLNGTENYFFFGSFDIPIKDLSVGGGTTGTWRATDDRFFLKGLDCLLNVNYKLYNNTTDSNVHRLSCTYFKEGIGYGNMSNLSENSSIINFSKDTILIKGKNYEKNYDFQCTLTRVQSFAP